MNEIKQKIQLSHLLSDEQKIAFLVEVDGFSEEEIAKIDEVLMRFEEQYQLLLSKYQEEVNRELAGILADDGDAPAVREAVEKVRTGIKMLQA